MVTRLQTHPTSDNKTEKLAKLNWKPFALLAVLGFSVTRIFHQFHFIKKYVVESETGIATINVVNNETTPNNVGTKNNTTASSSRLSINTDKDDKNAVQETLNSSTIGANNLIQSSSLPPHAVDNENLPTCAELMQQRSSRLNSSANESLLTRKGTPVVWKKRSDHSAELTLPSTCSMKRYAAHEALKCLKNKTILFVGDSLTRYQFLSLAYFLEHKNFPARFVFSDPCHHVDEKGKTTCSTLDNRNVCWAGVKYHELGGGIDGSVFNGRMEAMAVHGQTKRLREKTTARMQYVGPKADGGIKLNFAMEAGNSDVTPFNGYTLTGCAYNASCRQTDAEYRARFQRMRQDDFDWRFPSITDAFTSNGTVFQKQLLEGINYALYNRGIWGTIGLEKARVMMESLHRITRQSGDPSNRCFYKSTTAVSADTRWKRLFEGENNPRESGPVRNSTYHSGCEYFDVHHLTEAFGKNESLDNGLDIYMDGLHFKPWVYEELNNMLLNVLCNEHL